MRSRQQTSFVTAAIVLFVGTFCSWVFWSGNVFITAAHNAPNRAALLKIRDAIEIGSGYEDVLNACWSHRTQELQLRAVEPTAWIITMPFEFGAGDWNLSITFRDGKVTAIRVGNSDGTRPSNAPDDKR